MMKRNHPGRVNPPAPLAWTVLRAALGITLVLGGIKLAFPPDAAALAASYVDPESGWIAPYFVEQIENRLGVDVATFLRVQGFLEIALGLLLAAGLGLPVTAHIAALSFVAFAVANPVVGLVRLSRDVALAALCLAVALRPRVTREGVRRTIQWGLAYTLGISALFADGVMRNPLNDSLPVLIVLVAAAALALGLYVRGVAAAIAVWLGALILWRVAVAGPWTGLEGMKRELALAAGAWVLALHAHDDGSMTEEEVRGNESAAALAGVPRPGPARTR